MDKIRIIYINHIRDCTGYGDSAKDYILAMDKMGLNVIPRSFRLNNLTSPINPRILELEKQDARGATHIIQHTLPHHMKFAPNVKNIGLFASETSNFASSGWSSKLNTMNELWVPNRQMISACEESRVKLKPYVIPHCLDTSIFQRSYEPLDIPEIKDSFTFYFIGEFNRRKNLTALLKAFHTEFRPNEAVSLVLKVNKPGKTEEECTREVLEFCSTIRKGLKLAGKRHKEIIISQRLTEEQIFSLHSTCDCIVSPSYGEACSIPTLYALGFGNTPITTSITGQFEFITHENGYRVQSEITPVFGQVDNTFPDMYLGTENWWEISVDELKYHMRQCFENTTERRQKSLQGMKDIYEYGYDKIGGLIKDRLNERN